MSYKYTMNPSSQRFTISSFSTAYIFSEYLFLKYYCTFSLYKVTDFTIGESPRPSKETFCRYQLPVTKLIRHHLLPVTNPLGFSYQVTRYINYEELIRLLELRDQPIIQNISLILKHVEF